MPSSTCRHALRPVPFVECAFFLPLYGFAFFVENQVFICVLAYFWVFNSIPLINLSASESIHSVSSLLLCSSAWCQEWWFLQRYFYCLGLYGYPEFFPYVVEKTIKIHTGILMGLHRVYRLLVVRWPFLCVNPTNPVLM